MTIAELITDVDGAKVRGSADVAVARIVIDSRVVGPGDAFVALRGTSTDGHRYAGDAVAAGAVAVVSEEPVAAGATTNVVVPDSAKALARIAAHFFGDPADALVLCGVTGTNGKSSTALMLHSIMNATGRTRMGVIGTLGWGIDELETTTHTTPDAVALHGLFRDMKNGGCVGVVMEVSSHAVRQHRTWGLDFGVGIVTNVTRDHLDYHAGRADYVAAKTEFCHSLIAAGRRKPAGTLVYWHGDPTAREIGESFDGRRVRVGEDAGSDAYASHVTANLGGTRMTIRLQNGEEARVSTRLLGGFVAANASLAAAAAVELGADADAVSRGLASLDRIPGRFEVLGGEGRPTVVVDYAHTADAYTEVFAACRSLGARRLVAVFGCGGDRDRGKRPDMGEAAQRLCDASVVTTDNPRTEPVETIVDDILSGMRSREGVTVELDRARAIRLAIGGASEGDVVVLLGKGHEEYQIIGEEKMPFSDRATAIAALESWKTP